MGREKLQLPIAFEQIMQRHEREIMRYLLRVSGNREDAADLFQDTWLRAYRAYPTLDPHGTCARGCMQLPSICAATAPETALAEHA
jgi:DNA-directed RNA polymerase specialized sigma24 family protein